jgi:hypothetical protein
MSNRKCACRDELPCQLHSDKLAESERGEAEYHAAFLREKERAEQAELGIDMLRDCGQENVCATPPGCVRHWVLRNAELVRELDEARECLKDAMGCTSEDITSDAWNRWRKAAGLETK